MNIDSMEEITMRLVHYFITKENYQPVVVGGVKNELWLENTDAKYEVIRINSNYIHNKEQLKFDVYKTKSVVKQIKKKMFSIRCKTLNILLNVGEDVDLSTDEKNIDLIQIKNIKELDKKDGILKLFPEIENDKIETTNNIEFFLKVTDDINRSTEIHNKLYEKIFKEKGYIATYSLIVINVLIFILQTLGILNINNYFMSKSSFISGEYYRIITSGFFHVDIGHLLCNMFSLYILGKEIETVYGKKKYLIIYFVSLIAGSLMSGLLNGSPSVGASGAIFGLMGALLVFGYHFRLYFGNSLSKQIIPVIIINLLISIGIESIDLYGHLGGLIGGIFASFSIGIEGKTKKSDAINGIIVTVVFFIFLLYMLFR